RSAPGGIRAVPLRARGRGPPVCSRRRANSPSRLHLPLQVVVLEVFERKLDILDQRCGDLSHIQEGFVGRLERPEPLQYFISHLKDGTRFARHFETSRDPAIFRTMLRPIPTATAFAISRQTV